MEVDINQFLGKENNNIINQRKNKTKKAKDKVKKDVEKAKEKEKKKAKKDEKSWKSKHSFSSTSPNKDFLCITITEPPQMGCLYRTTLTIKTAADHITGPHGLCKGGFACSRVLLLLIPSIH